MRHSYAWAWRPNALSCTIKFARGSRSDRDAT